MTPNVQAPAPRDLGSELLQTYYGQARTAQPYFNLESYFQPKYGQVQLGNLQQQLFGYNVPQQAAGQAPAVGTQTGTTPAAGQGQPIYDNKGRITGYLPADVLRINRPGGKTLFQDPYSSGAGVPSQTPGYHPGTLALGAAANTYQRAADIGDIAALGPEAQQAFLAANPYLASTLGNLMGRTQDSPILRTLNQQAQDALAAGGQLTPQERAAVDQQTRAAYAARGLNMSDPAIASEILNRDAAVRQRMAAAQQLATGVQGLNQQQADLVGRAAQISSTTLSDPFQAILGRPSGAAGGLGGGGYPQQIGTGARLFDPTNPYAQDIYNTNYNAQASANIANANTQAATTNAGIGAGASILAAALPLIFSSDKRLKKKIRKVGTTPAGVPIKEFEYRHDAKKRRYRGVIAQDLEKILPGAVVTDPLTTLKAVDYGKLARFDFATLKAA